MRCYLISCNGYNVIKEVVVDSFRDLPALCLAAEVEANDGYAVLARHNSSFVADAEGVWPQQLDNNTDYRCGYDYACGYRD